MTQSAIQDLLNDPPSAKSRDPAFTGRDWKTVRVEEVVDEGKVRFVDMTTSVEKATEVFGRPTISWRQEVDTNRY